MDGDEGDDLHKAEDGDGDQIAEKELFERQEILDDGIVELVRRGTEVYHEFGVHGDREETVFV